MIGMIGMRYLHHFLVLSIFIGACWSSQNDVSTTVIVSIDQSSVHVGENVTLTCRVSTSGDAVDLSSGLQWRKSTTSVDNNEEVIADDEELSSLYEQFSAGRYEVDMVQLPEVTLYLLHISLVKHEDSGRIRCAFSSAFYPRNGQDIVNLLVYKRPSAGDVIFSDYAEDSEMTVEENVPTSLTCIVRRVLPQPHVSIHVHNRSVGHHLPTNVTVNVYCPVDARRRSQSARAAATPKTCPVHYDLDIVVIASHLIATHRDDEQRVTCTAGLSHANWTPVAASLNLNVRYRPRFNCSRSLSIQLGSRNMAIRCQLRYNPRPFQLLVRWRHHGDSNDTTLDVDSSIGDRYSLHEMVLDAKTWKETEMVFVIGQVHQKDYVGYHFEATNDVGTSTHSVHLIQHHPPRTPSLTTPTTTISHRSSTARSLWSRPVNSGSLPSVPSLTIGITELYAIVAIYICNIGRSYR